MFADARVMVSSGPASTSSAVFSTPRFLRIAATSRVFGAVRAILSRTIISPSFTLEVRAPLSARRRTFLFMLRR